MERDIKRYLEQMRIFGKINKPVLHKLLLIKSLKICNLAKANSNTIIAAKENRILDLLKKIK